MKHLPLSLALSLLSLPLGAANVPITFTNDRAEWQTSIFRGSLNGTGLSQLGLISIVDSNSGTGGAPGVFSGFDLDFIFLDLDGNYATAGDRIFGETFSFLTGDIRPTSNPSFQPTVNRPGPTSGSFAENTIDPNLSTLNTRDGLFNPFFQHTDHVSGSLTLGDGGSLTVGLASPVTLSGSEALFIGEVGVGTGELAGASVTVSPVPEPASFAMWCMGLLGISVWCRQKKGISKSYS